MERIDNELILCIQDDMIAIENAIVNLVDTCEYALNASYKLSDYEKKNA